ncbi:hypothetical protein CERZMDRAFT_94890 [Cercospora zeae-maydis SCOH1-5]|uniref:RING-type domain-containing protein n=1 Tax=Cercospora zeae-maydis SCOH1-5 TaxID=717836 RepID=A0A6A6FQB3_9PEZI|nr:hypothetical protein CERZMDRAFT_94890 [Cercospora zeae-maydis SCOH1-5]
MAAIEGLTEAQNAILQYVNVGDLLFVEEIEGLHYNSADEAEHGSDEEGDEIGEAAYGEGDSDHDDISSSASDDEGSTSGDDSNSTIDAIEDASAETESSKPTMYIIRTITKIAENIVEMSVTPLTFSERVGAQYGNHSYHILGDRCKANHACDGMCSLATSIKDVTSATSVFLINPPGDFVRITIKSPRPCLDTCKDGFLDSIFCLHDMVKDYVPEMLTYAQNNAGVSPPFLEKPLCPVCMGPSLLKEQQGLQYDLLVRHDLNFEAILDYHGRVAQRRSIVGYQFVQFDERRWGMAFDDMFSEDGEDYDDHDEGDFEHWEEAQDPNAIVRLHPASKETIAALPRKQFSEVQVGGEHEVCPIDQESFSSDCTLLQLPCGHVKFHEECIAEWLGHHGTCPICREVVPDVNGKQESEKTPEITPAAMRMDLQEALTSLGYAEDADFAALDQEMLPFIFGIARMDRPGWRTETAISRIQTEITLRAADMEDEVDQADGEALGEHEYGDMIMSDERRIGWDGAGTVTCLNSGWVRRPSYMELPKTSAAEEEVWRAIEDALGHEDETDAMIQEEKSIASYNAPYSL